MTTIAFIGLGIMGGPMAGQPRQGRLRRHRLQPQPGQGRRSWSPPAAGAPTASPRPSADADVVITMVPDSPDVEAVAAGDDGVFANAKPGHAAHRLVLASAPTSPRELAEAGAERGLRVLDAPVSGGEAGAIDASAVDHGRRRGRRLRRRPSRSSTPSARPIVHVGPSGSGQTVKAANQLIVAGNIELLAEAIVFLEAYGVDTEAALEVLGGGLAGSTVLDQKGANMLARDFKPGFRIDLHHKDLGIVTAAAREAGVVIPLGARRRPADRRRCGAQGDGGLDHSALLRGVERLSGRGSATADTADRADRRRPWHA